MLILLYSKEEDLARQQQWTATGDVNDKFNYDYLLNKWTTI